VSRSAIVQGLAVALCVLANACAGGEWTDFGAVWSPQNGMISLQCVVVDMNRFGETGSVPSAAPLYKMYYSNGVYPECKQVHFATSPDGVTWTFVAALKNEGKKPAVVYSPQGFGEGNAKYKMWHTIASTEEERHHLSSVRVCESADGLTWSESVDCVEGDPDRPLLEPRGGPELSNVWNKGSYGVLRVLFNLDGPAAPDPAKPMANRYVMYYNAYGMDPQSEADGGPSVGASVALAISADGVTWYRVGDAPVLRCTPKTTGGMVSFADVVKLDGKYLMCLLTDERPTEGIIRRIAQAESLDGVNWTVVSKDLATLKTDDGSKGSYGLSLAAEPATGTLQVWVSAGDGPGKLAIKYGRLEQ